MSKKKPIPPEELPETADAPLEDGAVDAQEAVQEVVQEDIESLKAQLEAAQKQSEEYLNMAQRVQADFENFRRRNNAARADSFEEGARAFIATILPRGVTVIDRAGEKFDPSLENAVMQGTAEEGEPGTVCAVLQKGYRMGDHVLRHAMVKVVAE